MRQQELHHLRVQQKHLSVIASAAYRLRILSDLDESLNLILEKLEMSDPQKTLKIAPHRHYRSGSYIFSGYSWEHVCFR